MKYAMMASLAAGFVMLAQPAFACANGYHAVWIQGNKVCRLNTPNLSLTAKQGVRPSTASIARPVRYRR